MTILRKLNEINYIFQKAMNKNVTKILKRYNLENNACTNIFNQFWGRIFSFYCKINLF